MVERARSQIPSHDVCHSKPLQVDGMVSCIFLPQRSIFPAYILPTIHIQYLTAANPFSEQFTASSWRPAISVVYIEVQYAGGTFERRPIKRAWAIILCSNKKRKWGITSFPASNNSSHHEKGKSEGAKENGAKSQCPALGGARWPDEDLWWFSIALRFWAAAAAAAAAWC